MLKSGKNASLVLRCISSFLFCVYGQTDWFVKGKQARLVIQTRAVDWNFDGGLEYNHKYCSIIYKNGKLTPIYKDINNDGYTDIVLQGTIQVFDNDWKNIIKQYPAKKVLLYNKSQNRFIEDLKQRTGFKEDDD